MMNGEFTLSPTGATAAAVAVEQNAENYSCKILTQILMFR